MFKNVLKFLNSKIGHVFVGFIYSYLYYLGYISFLNYYFDYAGFNIISNRSDDGLLLSITFFLAIFPVLFYNGVKNISSFLSIFIFYFLYVPIIITYFFDLDGSSLELIYSQALITFGMILFFLADRIHFKGNLVLPARIDIYKVILYLTIICTLYMLIHYRDNLKFVSFEDVYDLRFQNEELGSDIFTSYLSAFLTNSFIPLVLVIGLFYRKKSYFVVGTVASIIIYMTSGAKSVLLFPLIIFLLFKALNKRNLNLSLSIIGVALIIVMIITLNLDFNVFSSLFWMRTIGNSGSLTVKYHEFFTANPNTYYSHLNIVNYMTNSYPYANSLGKTVGSVYYSDQTNANANFWATDGYAALGESGVIVASFLMFFILLIFNSISARYNKLFVILVLIPYIISLLNGSLFSSLLTGGALIIMLLLSFRNKYEKL